MMQVAYIVPCKWTRNPECRPNKLGHWAACYSAYAVCLMQEHKARRAWTAHRQQKQLLILPCSATGEADLRVQPAAEPGLHGHPEAAAHLLPAPRPREPPAAGAPTCQLVEMTNNSLADAARAWNGPELPPASCGSACGSLVPRGHGWEPQPWHWADWVFNMHAAACC